MPSTLIVEDGTGITNADSYVASVDCDTYHANFGNAAWAGATQTAKDAALRQATQYLDSHYRFTGYQLTYQQALLWPRSNVWIYGVYVRWPVKRVVQACCELALRALTGKLQADVSDQVNLSEKVGDIEVRHAYSANAGQVRFAVVDDLLKPIATSGAGVLRVERA